MFIRLWLFLYAVLVAACSASDPPEISSDAALGDMSTSVDATASPDTARGPSETEAPPCGATRCVLMPGEAERVCVNNTCELRRCEVTHVLCGGRCQAISPANGCGSGSCEPCPPFENGEAICADSAARCSVRCNANAVPRDGRCQLLPAARPVWPPNGSVVYGRDVQLCATGALTAPGEQQRIEILDPQSEAVLQVLTTTTACADVPTTLLAPGRMLGWRVASVAGGAVGPASVMWRFLTDPRAVGGSLSRGVGALDNGAPGVLALGTQTGAVALLPGASNLRMRPPTLLLPSPEVVAAGRVFALLDANRDARAEFAMGVPGADAVFLWRNPAASSTPEVTLRLPATPAPVGFGAHLAVGRFSDGAGDDLAVASAMWDRVAVFTNLASTPRATLVPLGALPVAMGAGGVMGGSFDDLVVATRERLLVFRAAPEGVRTSAAVSLAWNASPTALDVADVLADGYADIVVRTPSELRVYRGGDLDSSGAVQTIATPTGTTLVCADVTGDRVADCALVAENELRVYRGGPGGLSLTPTITRGAAGIDQGQLTALVARDLNGDGLLDVAALSRSAGEGTVLVYTGIRGGLANDPVVLRMDLMGDVVVGPMR